MSPSWFPEIFLLPLLLFESDGKTLPVFSNFLSSSYRHPSLLKLWAAVRRGQLDKAKRALARGADINATVKDRKEEGKQERAEEEGLGWAFLTIRIFLSFS